MSDSRALVFFDGVCGLCNRSVNFLLRADRKRDRLRFATLQGEKAKELGLVEEGGEMNSMVLLLDGKLYYKSTAALRTLIHLGGLWNVLWIFFIFPRFLRDPVYNLIAKNRYRIWGKMDACRLPTPEEAAKFVA